MNKIKKYFWVGVLLLTAPTQVLAAGAPRDLSGLMNRFIEIIGVAVKLLMSLAVFAFLYGLTVFMWKGQESDTERANAKSYMTFGIISLFVMVSLWGLVGILSQTIFG